MVAVAAVAYYFYTKRAAATSTGYATPLGGNNPFDPTTGNTGSVGDTVTNTSGWSQGTNGSITGTQSGDDEYLSNAASMGGGT